MEDIISRLKALADTNRLRILMMIKQRPICACELLEVLDIAGGTLSNHLKILKNAGFLKQNKDGRWIVYDIKDSNAMNILNDLDKYIEDKSFINNDINKINTLNRNICSKKI